MRKLFALAGIIIALAFPAMSFGADTAVTLHVTGGDSDVFPEPEIIKPYDEENYEKGEVTFPAVSGTNYAFSTLDNALKFATGPQAYITDNFSSESGSYIQDETYYDSKGNEYTINYDSSLQSAMTTVTVSIGISTIDATVDNLSSYKDITDLTFTATKDITGPYGERFFIAEGISNITFSNINFKGNDECGGVEVKGGTVTFSGCTFDKCYMSESGGGLLVTGGTVSISGSTFSDCHADNNGGAISVTGGTVSMNSTTFTGNTAENGNGGAIYTTRPLTISSDVNFNTQNASSPNTAINGGAIYASNTLTITGSGIGFTGNIAEYGGAIYAASAALNISGSEIAFDGNTVSNNGGAIHASGDKAVVTISGATFSGNDASDGRGGAILAGGGAAINIDGAATFTNNEANYGGAVYLSATSRGKTALNITGENEAAFTDNGAETDGGAIYAEQNSRMNFAPTVSFTGNYTNNGNGGAMWVYDASQLPEGTVYFDSNKSAPEIESKSTPKGCGGAIYIGGSSTSSMTFGSTRNYTFAGNEAASYGGALCTYSSDIVFDGYVVSDENKAALGGGFAAALNSSKITLNNSSISNQNSTKGNGGAIYSLGELEITDSDFRRNSAQQGGGALYAVDSLVSITNSYFVSNDTRQGNGGAIALQNYCRSSITSSTFYMNKSSKVAGGAIYAQGTLDITLSYFRENKGKTSGGAIYFDQNNDSPSIYSKFTMTSTMLQENTTDGDAGNGGGLFVAANNVTLDKCTFDNNRLVPGNNAGEGGGAYVSAMPIQDENVEITNCTFYDNHIDGGIDGESGGGGLAVHCEKTTVIKSCTFSVNGSRYKGGAIYLGEGSLQLLGTIAVGNTDEGIYDIWSDGNISSGGYNRIGVYGTGTGVTNFYSDTRNDTDRTAYPSKGWTRATFFSKNILAVNERTDLGSNIPPYLGSTLSSQARLMTLMLSEDASLPLIDRATNIIPYTRRGMFPTTDERGVARISQGSQINLDIGACFFDGTRFVSGDSEIASYTISRLEISGIPNNLRRVGQTASLLAKVYYTNGRTALGGYGDGEEPVEWASDKPNIIRINKDTGDITVLSFTPGDTYVTITATTVRTDTSGQRISDKQPVKVTEYTYSYLNTSPEIMNYLQGYVQQLTEYDISLQLADVSASAVSSLSFQSAFAGIWGNATASQITDLTNAALAFDTVTNYATSGYVLAAGKPGVNINFAGLKEGDIFPLTYSWTFSGSDLQSILGYDMAGKTVTASLADEIFSALRLDFQGADYSSPVIGSGGVKASEAMSAGALALSTSDGGKGLTAQITVYLANVTAGGNLSSSANDGPQIVEGMLIVPDGTGNDGRIFGSMFMAAKTDSAQEVSTNTGTQTGAKSSSGGGGCESFGAALSSLALLLMAVQKRRRQ